MSEQIPKAYVNEYSEDVRHLAQQQMMKVRGTVVERSISANREWLERVGKVQMQKRTGRRRSTTYTDTPHSRRLLVSSPYFVADTVDEDDAARVKIQADQEYRLEQSFASNRTWDDIVIPAFTADVIEGDGEDESTTTVSFDTSNQQVAANYVESGSPSASNLTVGKVRKAWEILMSNHTQPGNLFALTSANQVHNLMTDEEFTSRDYSTLMPLMTGQVEGVSWMGFRWRLSERLPIASDERSNFFYDRRAITLGVRREFTTRVDEIPDMHYMTQIYSDLDGGAVRMEDDWVVEVLCDETAGV